MRGIAKSAMASSNWLQRRSRVGDGAHACLGWASYLAEQEALIEVHFRQSAVMVNVACGRAVPASRHSTPLNFADRRNQKSMSASPSSQIMPPSALELTSMPPISSVRFGERRIDRGFAACAATWRALAFCLGRADNKSVRHAGTLKDRSA